MKNVEYIISWGFIIRDHLRIYVDLFWSLHEDRMQSKYIIIFHAIRVHWNCYIFHFNGIFSDMNINITAKIFSQTYWWNKSFHNLNDRFSTKLFLESQNYICCYGTNIQKHYYLLSQLKNTHDLLLCTYVLQQ